MPQEFEINIPVQEPTADITAEEWGDTLPEKGQFPEFERIQERMRYRKFGETTVNSTGIWG